MMLAMSSKTTTAAVSVATCPVLALTTSRMSIVLHKHALLIKLLASLIFLRVEVLVGEQTGTRVLLLNHNVSVIERLDVLFQARTTILLRLLHKLLENTNKNVSIECSVMLLGEAQGSTLPVADLFHLTNLLAQHAQGDLGQTRLLLHETNLSEVGLRIDESLNILHELEVRVLPRKLLDIGRETETNDDTVLVVEHFAHGLVEQRAPL